MKTKNNDKRIQYRVKYNIDVVYTKVGEEIIYHKELYISPYAGYATVIDRTIGNMINDRLLIGSEVTDIKVTCRGKYKVTNEGYMPVE